MVRSPIGTTRYVDKLTAGSALSAPPRRGVGTRTVADALHLPGLSAPDIAGLEPLAPLKRRWPSYLGAAITALMVAILVWKLSALGWRTLLAAFPRSPLFYLSFAGLYAAPVVGDYVIFRGLWRIPPAGFVALAKKRIANEMLNYSGEAYFYAWARQRASLVAAPFGAVKDVSILSAIAGNTMTLALIAVALPLGKDLLSAQQFSNAILSTALVMLMSAPFLIFSKRVFSLPRPTLWWIFGVHCLRLVAGFILVALTWHFGLPGVSLGWWLLLAAARQIVGRLPLVPNKDLLFATFAAVLIGQDAALKLLIAVTAALPLLVHVVLIGMFFLAGLIGKTDRA